MSQFLRSRLLLSLGCGLVLALSACQQQATSGSGSSGIRNDLPSVDYRRMSDWRRNALKGEVRTLERWLTQTDDPDGLTISDSVLLERTVFNEAGWMVRAEQYNTDGVMQIVIERTFDSTGLLQRATAQMPSTGEMQQTTYSYDAGGRLTGYQIQGTRGGATMTAVMNFVYDEQGRCVGEAIRGAGGEQTSSTKRTFDERGNVLEEIVTDNRDRMATRTQYDGLNRIVFNKFDSLQGMEFNRDARFTPEKSESLIVSGYSAAGYSMITKQIAPTGFESRRIVIDPTGADTNRYDIDYKLDPKGNWKRKTIRLFDQTPDPNMPQLMVELQQITYFD